MAEKTDKIAKKPSSFYGVLITSSVESGSLAQMNLPQMGQQFMFVGPSDVLGNNTIEVFAQRFPLFASSEISYKGEPLGALFGPDAESAELASRLISFDMEEKVAAHPLFAKRTHEPIEYLWGDLEKAFGAEAATIVEKSYVDRRMVTAEDLIIRAKAWQQEDLLHIQVPTQWPFHVRDTVASVCNRTQKSVVIHPLPHFSPKDEKLLHPSILAAASALGALKSGATIYLSHRQPTYKSAVIITRKTALDAQGKPLGEQVDAVIDQGAFPLFADEAAKQLLAGLVPLYPLQAFSARVHIVESSTPPSHFFGDIGYSSALFSSELHCSLIAKQLALSPANWRIKQYGESKERAKVLQTLAATKLRDLVGTVVDASDFSRHYGAYELQRRTKRPLSSFINYNRGVGIACGAGISGFAGNSYDNIGAKIALTLESHNRVIVNTSFYPSEKLKSMWKGVISEELSVEEETIEFVEHSTATMVDSGPEVLSVDVGRSVMMINECCRAISARRFQDPLPITESVTAKSIMTNLPTMFSSRNWGSLVIELEVNVVTLRVETRRVWGRFYFNNPPDIENLKIKIRHIINASLFECNIDVVHQEGSQPVIDIDIEAFGDDPYPTSATSALRAMVMAASCAALSQALNCEVNSLPLSDDDIVTYVRRKE
ncbi:MAG: molybdopterin cofactor-binding domain-containing protein [Sphaerochaetaceae bacterium]